LLLQEHPCLFIELHGFLLSNPQAYGHNLLTFLQDYGYRAYHIERQQIVTPETPTLPTGGHIYCEAGTGNPGMRSHNSSR